MSFQLVMDYAIWVVTFCDPVEMMLLEPLGLSSLFLYSYLACHETPENQPESLSCQVIQMDQQAILLFFPLVAFLRDPYEIPFPFPLAYLRNLLGIPEISP